MTPGSALASRAIGDATRRDLASEWGGPEPAANRSPQRDVRLVRDAGRHVVVRKPWMPGKEWP